MYAYLGAICLLGKEWSVNADVTYKMGGILLPLGVTNGFVANTFGVNKKFSKVSGFTFSASVTNPFSKYRYVREQITGLNFTQSSTDRIYYRVFNLSVNYRFGKLKEEIRRNKRGIKNDDDI